MAVRTLHVLELCAGYGGFSLAFDLLGLHTRTVAYVERDSHAASTLVARMEDQALDRAPVWDDLTTFAGHQWCGVVDLVCAGFPCQPWSSAGRRSGVDDDRWLWPEIARIVADVAPSYVFLENVPGLNPGKGVGGLPYVLQDLADFGFDAEWGLLSAAAVGATHKRERFWLLAFQSVARVDADVGHSGSEGRREDTGSAPSDEVSDGRRQDAADQSDGADPDVADAEGVGQREPVHQERPFARGDAWQDASRRGFPPDPINVADADGVGGQAGDRCRDLDEERRTLAWPPGPEDVSGWATWLAGGGPEPRVRRVVDGATGRLVRPVGLSDRLHLLGNGLVPQVAAVAFKQLAERAGIWSSLT